MEGRSGGMGEGRGREAGGGAEQELEPEPESEPAVAVEAVMSVQVVSAAADAKVPEVELKDLSPSEAQPQLALSTAAVSAMAPAAGGGDPEAPAPAGERPPAPGPGSGPAAAALSPAAGKVPQASAMKRSDPHHQHQRHRDGGEALVSPDGTVTEAPRTVKKVLGPGCLSRRGREGDGRSSRLGGTTLHALPSDRGSRETRSPLTPGLREMPPPGPSAGERSVRVALRYFAVDSVEGALSPTTWNRQEEERHLILLLPTPPTYSRVLFFRLSGENTPMA